MGNAQIKEKVGVGRYGYLGVSLVSSYFLMLGCLHRSGIPPPLHGIWWSVGSSMYDIANAQIQKMVGVGGMD